MNTLTCEEVAELLPELALGALDDQVLHDRLLAHIDQCPGCRGEYESLQDATNRLALAVPQQAPPAGLKDALMAQIVAAPTTAPDSPAPALDWRAWLRSIFTQPAFVLSAVIAVAALAGYGYLALRPAPVAPAVNQLDRIANASTAAIKFNGTPQAPDAWADMRFQPDDQVAVLVVGDLPALEAGKVYQLWLVDNSGKRDTGALFNCGDKRSAKVLVEAPRRMRDYVRFGVTIEPEGGSPGPTGPGVLRSVRS